MQLYTSIQVYNDGGGRATTIIAYPSHILLIFSSEPPQNPRASDNIFLNGQPLQIKIFFESGLDENLLWLAFLSSYNYNTVFVI